MKNRLLAFVLIFCLIAAAAGAEHFVPTKEMPSKGPAVTFQPADASVKQGGSCEFSVGADKAKGITWRLYDPETGETVLCTHAAERFPGLSVSGKNGKTLRLSGVPESLNGWMAFCVLTSGNRQAVSQYALITVTDAAGQPLPGARQFLQDPAEVRIIRVTGTDVKLRTADYKGRAVGASASEMEFEEKARLVAAADRKTDTWYINGVRYVFPAKVGSIVITELEWDLDIRAGGAETNAASGSGEGLEVQTVNARMLLRNGAGKTFGERLTKFDFSSAYPMDDGTVHAPGTVSVKVMASVPNGKYVSYWKFNEVHFDFDVRVTSFLVDDLNTAFVYEPVFGAPKQPDVPQKDDSKKDETYEVIRTTDDGIPGKVNVVSW